MKIIAILHFFTILSPLFTLNDESFRVNSRDNNYLVIEEGKAVSISKPSLYEYRIYHEYNDDVLVDSIGENVFDLTTNKFDLMISNGVTSIDLGALSNSNILSINYTGSKEEWEALNITFSKPVNYYQKDEGFINYWNRFIRTSKDVDICLIKESDYRLVKGMYDALESYDRSYVNDYRDITGQTIKQSMTLLDNMFKDNKDNHQGAMIKQDTMIALVVSIAISGMTAISIFYLLKQKNIIS